MTAVPDAPAPTGWYTVSPAEVSRIWQPEKSLSWRTTLATDYGISNAAPMYLTEYNPGTYIVSGTLDDPKSKSAKVGYFVLNVLSSDVQIIKAPTELKDIITVLTSLNGRLKSSDPSIKESLTLEEVRTVFDDTPPPVKTEVVAGSPSAHDGKPEGSEGQTLPERRKPEHITPITPSKTTEVPKVEQEIPHVISETPERASTKTPDPASIAGAMDDSINEE